MTEHSESVELRSVDPMEVVECPTCHEVPGTVVSMKITDSSRIRGVWEIEPNRFIDMLYRDPNVLIGWEMACGCFVGADFSLLIVADQAPRFVRTEDLP